LHREEHEEHEGVSSEGLNVRALREIRSWRRTGSYPPLHALHVLHGAHEWFPRPSGGSARGAFALHIFPVVARAALCFTTEEAAGNPGGWLTGEPEEAAGKREVG
jgi:hypothetical protein